MNNEEKILMLLEQMSERQDRTETILQQLQQGQSSLEQGQKSLEQGFKSLEQRQISLESKFDDVDDRLKVVEITLENNTKKILNLLQEDYGRVANHTRVLEGHNKRISTLAEKVI